MPDNDLVVVLPGITGSTLTRQGTPIWAPSAGAILRAIGTLGRNLNRLQLPDGIGDEHPDDGVEPGVLMPDLHVIPGLWTPIRGYTSLLTRLRALGYHEDHGNLLPIAYDWRLSNRYNARRLATLVEPTLERWRAASPDNRDARLVFIGHSMGGLLARWYIEHQGGAEITRKLITLGTPYRGAAKALLPLVNGVRKDVGPLAVDLTAFARSMPSLHQLLPTYACIDQPGGLATLTETTLPELDTTMTTDAQAFHHGLACAESARPASLAMTHAIIGARQTTVSTIHIIDGRAEPLDTIDGDNDYGDGTVPLAGAIGHDLPMDTNTVRRIIDHHGSIQANPYVLDEVEEILTTIPIRRRAPATVPVQLTAPDIVLVGDQVPITAQLPPGAREAIQITIVNEHERLVFSRRPSSTGGIFHTSAPALPPGGYEIRVTGIRPGSPVTPVTIPILVWDPTSVNA
ncbi:esterase/lipase family protein [Umezawaea endophytica]|uniref:Lecithin:cholesterol acyltransferase n=1 Tax=Umezawaea endophytica TaxID=1654476 RepID=A0A9X2VY66_9PSEU|nr:hypothetical protein [Umezawaea endophytica]MCS7484572.1 hypothetical protein [Umezawaea endophytica]